MPVSASTTFEAALRPWRRDPATPPHRSLWLNEALGPGAIGENVLQGDVRADVCIVGGGFTGLWTAIRLSELDPKLNVVIVEADLCGAGASGRCSGGVGSWWGKLTSLVEKLGDTDGLRVLQASSAAVRDIDAFVGENDIDCDLRRGPSLWGATAPAQVGAWESVFRTAERLGLTPPWRRLADADVQQRFGRHSPYIAGVLIDKAIRVQPAKLARGLRHAALQRGVAIYERSPVSHIRADGSGITVETSNGEVAADQVVLAANAWMAHLPEFRPFVTVISSEIVATDPIPGLLERLGMRDFPGGINSRLMVNYGGITPKGQVYLGRGGGTIAFAGRVGPEFDRSEAQIREVEDDFRYFYPELRGTPLPHGWSGPIDRSTTGLPWLGHLAGSERVHFAIGYSGHGVGASALAGRMLASNVLRRNDEWSSLTECLERARHGRFPPEPIRYLGGQVVRAAVARKEMAERERRSPSRIDAALARLAPGSISDLRKVPPVPTRSK